MRTRIERTSTVIPSTELVVWETIKQSTGGREREKGGKLIKEREKEGINQTMADELKADAPLFELLSTLLQQVRIILQYGVNPLVCNFTTIGFF